MAARNTRPYEGRSLGAGKTSAANRLIEYIRVCGRTARSESDRIVSQLDKIPQGWLHF